MMRMMRMTLVVRDMVLVMIVMGDEWDMEGIRSQMRMQEKGRRPADGKAVANETTRKVQSR